MKERHDGFTTLFSLLNVEHSAAVVRNKGGLQACDDVGYTLVMHKVIFLFFFFPDP